MPSCTATITTTTGVVRWPGRVKPSRMSLEAFHLSSWLIILRKRENFRRAFFLGLGDDKIACHTDVDVRRLPPRRIVRTALRLRRRSPTRMPILIGVVRRPIRAVVVVRATVPRPCLLDGSEIPLVSTESKAMSRELKRRGSVSSHHRLC